AVPRGVGADAAEVAREVARLERVGAAVEERGRGPGVLALSVVEDVDAAPPLVERCAEREAVEVVRVEVGQEHEPLVAAAEEGTAQRPLPRARVEDGHPALDGDGDAGRVASVAYELRARRRRRSADTPERNRHQGMGWKGTVLTTGDRSTSITSIATRK